MTQELNKGGFEEVPLRDKCGHESRDGRKTTKLRPPPGQCLWVVMMHHVPGIFDLDRSSTSDGLQPFLHVRPGSLVAFLAPNDQNGTIDAAKELQRLPQVEGLRSHGAVQRV